VKKPDVKARATAAGEQERNRGVEYAERCHVQRRELDLRPFPTTTIGSFPQTPEARRSRNRLQKGEIGQEEHDRFIADDICSHGSQDLDGTEGLIFHFLHACRFRFYADAKIWEIRRTGPESSLRPPAAGRE
jgi:hypothetical protein